ncbi:hypothetical protein [Altericroceibacterium endophyticum]|uniref:Iron transporter n=1 Tax=Altericroceibacterium endophyticum TaxID=1808508 RepID=A0A6I4SZR1_9SPHN|nr:hypothetical protein [Altericroceibacterium endophyticum]MXO64304.1 hypothetical protein [Altericroceibacterium endophyticum]
MAVTKERTARISGWNIAARLVAAIPANYLVTSLATACLARMLPMPPAEASVAATLFSFALFAVIALTAFGLASLTRLWVWMLGAGLVLGAGLWLSLITGGRL